MNRIMGRYNATLREDFRKQGLTIPQVRTLAVLSVMDGVTVNDLSVYTVIEQSTLSAARSTRWRRKAWCGASRATTDSRVRKVFLTDEGRAEFGRAWPAMHDAFEAMFDGIDDAEYAALIATLQKMLQQHPQARHLTYAPPSNRRQRRRRQWPNGPLPRKSRSCGSAPARSFAGEGILAITKALLQCGVGYVGGYQGAPISHLMDVLADAQDILGELGVHFEASASEATATAMLAASVHYPIRGAATFKSTVGTNVASDALANLASGGVTGGALIIVGEDYGEGSSIMQERSHAFAMKSQVWLLDPRPNLPSIVKAVEDGFELSEASNTPVMLLVRIRCCHVHGSFTAKDNKRPAMTVAEALSAPRRDTGRIVLPPASFLHEKEKVEKRWPAAVDFIRVAQDQRVLRPGGRPVGIVMQGGMYNARDPRAAAHRASPTLMARPNVPLYVLNAVYPLIDDEFLSFCEGKDAVLVVEEGPAQLHRAGLRRDAAQGGTRHQAGRQGASADGRRIYRPGHARRHRRVPARQGRASAAGRGQGAEHDRQRRSRSPTWSASCRAARRASASAARSGRSSRRRSWSSRSSASTTSPPTSAAICSRSCRPSSSARPPWATGWARPRPRPSIRRRRRDGRSPSSATAASGTTA